MGDPEGLAARAFMNPPSMALRREQRRPGARAEIPGANGHGDARALARVYGALARGGVRTASTCSIRPASRAAARSSRTAPTSCCRSPPASGSASCCRRTGPTRASARAAARFGHPGAGGSLGFADPDARVGFGYVMNRMGPHILLDPRAVALIDAVYGSLS